MIKYIFYFFIVYNVSFLHATQNDKLIGLTIALYSYPTDPEGSGAIWDAVAEAGKKIPITAIIGVNSSQANKDTYVNAIDKLHKSNIRILAYVSTALSTSNEDPPQPRDIVDVKAEINDFADNFDIDGIFLDEGLAFDELENGEELFDYYEELAVYVKSSKNLKSVMLNVSFIIKEDIERSSIDDFLVFENSLSNWESFLPSQYEGLDYKRLHILVHGDYDSLTMQDLLQESAENKIVNVYFTDKDFHLLPSFWYDEVNAIQTYNNLIKATYLPSLYYLLY